MKKVPRLFKLLLFTGVILFNSIEINNPKQFTLAAEVYEVEKITEILPSISSAINYPKKLTQNNSYSLIIPISQPIILQISWGMIGGIAIIVVLGIVIIVIGIDKLLGIIRIEPDEVGIIYKKIGKSLASGQSIAVNGEAGYQAKILPPGLHKWYWRWLYRIDKVPKINIPLGEIGLVIAKDGKTTLASQRLGRVVNCNDFQDGEAFLKNGGQKGTQLAILTTGEYRINTELFTLITAANANQHGMQPEQLKVYTVDSSKIGIVTTKDGQPLDSQEIAGPIIPGHNKFQDPQTFIDEGGYRGLQEEILPAGDWNLNPKFVEVEQIPLTHIPPGTVGVIISYVGKTSQNPSHDPVEEGDKGICKIPKYPGQYPINTKVKDVLIIPTHQITLDWSDKKKPDTNYDANLLALKLRSKDGFVFNIEVTQLIRITGDKAPIMISRIGSPDSWRSDETDLSSPSSVKYRSVKNLVTRVLEPMVGNYFRISQNYKALDFHDKRDERQIEAESYIQSELGLYGVKADGTFINEIDLPTKLEKILTEREQAEQSIPTLEAQIKEEEVRGKLEKQKAISSIQGDVVKRDFKQTERIQELEILGHRIQLVGGFQNALNWEKVQKLPEIKLPNVLVNSNGQHSGVFDAFMAPMLESPYSENIIANPINNTAISSGEGTKNLLQLESSPPRCPAVIILDTSSSMLQDYLQKLTEGLETFQQAITTKSSMNSCIEVTTITCGGSVEIVQSFTDDKNFIVPKLELKGNAEITQGIEQSLEILEARKKIYSNTNLNYSTPWIFLITGSIPHDNYQETAEKVQKAIEEKQINFIVISIQENNKEILSKITPNYFLLEDLKFKPVFYWMANIIKGIPKKHFLSKFAETVAVIQLSLPENQAKILESHMNKLITEASKDRPKRSDYTPIIVDLRKFIISLGDIGKPILELIPLITQTLELT